MNAQEELLRDATKSPAHPSRHYFYLSHSGRRRSRRPCPSLSSYAGGRSSSTLPPGQPSFPPPSPWPPSRLRLPSCGPYRRPPPSRGRAVPNQCGSQWTARQGRRCACLPTSLIDQPSTPSSRRCSPWQWSRPLSASCAPLGCGRTKRRKKRRPVDRDWVVDLTHALEWCNLRLVAPWSKIAV